MNSRGWFHAFTLDDTLQRSPLELVILHCGKEMAFKNFVVEGNDKDSSFMTREPTGDFKTGSPSVSINNEPSAIRAELRVLTRTVGCEYDAFKGLIRPPRKLITPLRVTRQKALMVLTKVSKANGEPSTPLDVFNEDSNLHAQGVRRFPSLGLSCYFSFLEELSGWDELGETAQCDAIQERERVKDKEYVKMEAKCNVALENLDKNPLVVVLQEEAWTLKGGKGYRLPVFVKEGNDQASNEATPESSDPIEVLLSKKHKSL
ncbi:hypothetical protein Tco_1401956 [Tanacetum coccineum]